jgi:Predicted glutamine amidotransferases
MKPSLGITCNYDPRDTDIRVTGLRLPGLDWEFLAWDFFYTIEKAGGIPTIIPYCREHKNIVALIDIVDRIVM